MPKGFRAGKALISATTSALLLLVCTATTKCPPDFNKDKKSRDWTHHKDDVNASQDQCIMALLDFQQEVGT